MSALAISDIDALRVWRATVIEREGGPLFMGIPDRWYDAPGPRLRCTQGHVSRCVLKSEERGDLCLACQEPVLMTFPEDVDGEVAR
jgi:hypothetical protein